VIALDWIVWCYFLNYSVCLRFVSFYNKKYVLSNSESVQCNFYFIFDHVTFIQFKICCCVQNFMKILWFFTEIWRYNDFQNGSRPPSWNCFTAVRDHPRSLCCWPQLPVKFHVNLVHRSEDIAIWIFPIFGWKCLSRPQNGGLLGLCTPKCDYSSSRPPKRTSLRKSASVKLSTVNKKLSYHSEAARYLVLLSTLVSRSRLL